MLGQTVGTTMRELGGIRLLVGLSNTVDFLPPISAFSTRRLTQSSQPAPFYQYSMLKCRRLFQTVSFIILFYILLSKDLVHLFL